MKIFIYRKPKAAVSQAVSQIVSQFVSTTTSGTEPHDSADVLHYDFDWADEYGQPTALDVLLAAQRDVAPGLAYRYGCRNELCGVCTVEINGKPRLACRTRVRDGDRVQPLSTLPHVRDLVVERDGINRQVSRRLPMVEVASRTGAAAYGAPGRYHSLGRCIECYACLDGCPLHGENFPAQGDGSGVERDSHGGYLRGNPYTFLRLERVRLDPASEPAHSEAALTAARELGIDRCRSCEACKCQVGIHLIKDVIRPLSAAVGQDDT